MFDESKFGELSNWQDFKSKLENIPINSKQPLRETLTPPKSGKDFNPPALVSSTSIQPDKNANEDGISAAIKAELKIYAQTLLKRVISYIQNKYAEADRPKNFYFAGHAPSYDGDNSVLNKRGEKPFLGNYTGRIVFKGLNINYNLNLESENAQHEIHCILSVFGKIGNKAGEIPGNTGAVIPRKHMKYFFKFLGDDALLRDCFQLTPR